MKKLTDIVNEKWSEKYKRSIDCSNPQGFSQRAHCQGREKNEGLFSSDNKIKPYEKLLVSAVVDFMKSKLGFNAQIIVKKKSGKALFGDVILNDNSINKNKFYVHYNPNQSYDYIIKSLIHELTHVKQISKGELRPSSDYTQVLWKGKPVISAKEYSNFQRKDINKYKNLPWEKEAYSNMQPLYKQFLNSPQWNNLVGQDATLDYVLSNIG